MSNHSDTYDIVQEETLKQSGVAHKTFVQSSLISQTRTITKSNSDIYV